MTKTFAVMKSTLALFLTLGMTSASLAQSTTGSIRGTVLDPSGALIARAQVRVTNAAGAARTLVSDDDGAFDVEGLAAGSYSVSVDAAGFTPTLEGVQVAGDKVTEETVKLGISVYQDVEVFADR